MSRRLAPPGQTEEVRARRVLVISPHHDDETIGCGGLLASLADSGARVTVLFLSDGAGGVEGVPKSLRGEVSSQEEQATSEAAGDDAAVAEYRRRRRREAERALEILGVRESRHLELPDGGLADRIGELADVLAEVLGELSPDLVLVPGPLETTPDHQAAFAALHECLLGLRPGGALHAKLEPTVFLAYEVNHPAYPDLLVDVSTRLEVVERALDCYESQLARHDYAAAAIGLRRYRTHSLEPSVKGAEAYSRLDLEDFVTRTRSELVEHLGGASSRRPIAEGPLVSVVVRTRDRPELLAEALASLARSTHRRLEVVVVNDGGETPRTDAAGDLDVRVVELEENRGRAAAANAGVAAARGQYVGFLDDDDLVAPEHFATLVDLVSAAGVRAAYTDASVGVYRLVGGAAEDGRGERGWVCVERRLPYSRDFSLTRLLLDNFVPLHTLLFDRSLFDRVGPFDETLDFFEDWDWLIRLGQVTTPRHLARVTCEYRHFESSTHHVLGAANADRRADFVELKGRVLAKHSALLTPDALAEGVVQLRREAVEAHAAASAARTDRRSLAEQLADQAAQRETVQRLCFQLEREKMDVERDRAELERSRAELEKSWHRLNGEVVTLRDERVELHAGAATASAEIEGLREEERRLRATIEEKGALEARLYAEIERLNSLIRSMEQTRAWKLHRLLHRSRSPG